MPGIAGIISRQPAADWPGMVKAMTATMRHESFYEAGAYAAPALGVHAGWLAHPGSGAGQWRQNTAGDVVLLFAGECFPAVNAEQLIADYEAAGDAFLPRLNGLFSGLLIDQRRQRVLLFNDRYGMERVYWHETPAAFYFASEAKALLRVLPELREFDREGVAQFLGAGCPLRGRTLFRNVQLLPGGACWSFRSGLVRREKYFSSSAWAARPELSPAEYEAEFSRVFSRILPRYFEAESKLGVSLTGGLDTRAIMAGHRHDPARETSYTFTGPAGETLDDRVAARVAAECGLEHRLVRLETDFFATFPAQVDRTVFITDGASGAMGAHEIYFHRKARALAPVRLTGNFGSEVLRGVSTFKPPGLAPEIFHPDFMPAIRAAAAELAVRDPNPAAFAAFQEAPLNLFGNFAAGRSQLRFRTPYLDNELVALAHQCPAALRKSPRPMIRFIKAGSPVLDRIPTDRGFISDRRDPEVFARRVLAEVTFKLDYCSDAGLPRRLRVLDPVFKPAVRALGVAGLHKFLKYGTWFRENQASYVVRKITAAQSMTAGFWDAEALGHMVSQHLAGTRDFPAEIAAVLTLESVERQLFRELPRRLET